jgi:hypothetical protein
MTASGHHPWFRLAHGDDGRLRSLAIARRRGMTGGMNGGGF